MAASLSRKLVATASRNRAFPFLIGRRCMATTIQTRPSSDSSFDDEDEGSGSGGGGVGDQDDSAASIRAFEAERAALFGAADSGVGAERRYPRPQSAPTMTDRVAVATPPPAWTPPAGGGASGGGQGITTGHSRTPPSTPAIHIHHHVHNGAAASSGSGVTGGGGPAVEQVHHYHIHLWHHYGEEGTEAGRT